MDTEGGGGRRVTEIQKRKVAEVSKNIIVEKKKKHRKKDKGNKTVSEQPDFCISIKISQCCRQIHYWLTKACKLKDS